MCFSIDKRLKIDKPLGNVYLSTEARLIKVVDTAPSNNTRAVEIAIETAKTGKVTAVVAVMSIFCKKKCKLWNANPGHRKPSCQKAESANFMGENFHKLRNLSRKTKKGRLSKKLAPKLKKLELNSTSLKLKSKTSHLDCAKKPDPSVSYGLKVRNKTIGVLLDSGPSGYLLFEKIGSTKHISVAKRAVPQSWGTSSGTFITDNVGDIDISFVEYSTSKKVCLQLIIVEYGPGDQAPMYDLIISKQTLHNLGVVLDFKEKTIQIDEILLPMRIIANLKFKPCITRALGIKLALPRSQSAPTVLPSTW